MQLNKLEKIIDRYLAGEASEKEKEFIENYWLHQPINDSKLTSEEKGRIAEEIWAAVKLQSGISSINTTIHAHRRIPLFKKLKIFHYAAAAAVILAVVGFLSWYYILSGSRNDTSVVYTSVRAMPREVVDYILPDSSVMHLFPGSLVQIPDNYNKDDRKLKIAGKVFFEVKHNPSSPFYVLAGALQTKVLGTSFEVNTFNSNYPAIIVRTGKVGVSYQGKQLIQLGVNDQLHVRLPSAEIKLDKVNAAVLCDWWNGTFSFEQTPLPDVLESIEKWYGVTVNSKTPRWSKEMITIQLKNTMSIGEVMSLLSETLDFSYQINGQNIMIY